MAEKFSYKLKIPEDRIGVLIGKEGDVKKEIEESTESEVEVDSDSGKVKIVSEDGLNIYNAKEVVRAISNGFNPEKALSLVKTDKSLEIVDLSNYCSDPDELKRIKGRIIGSNGRVKEELENLSNTDVCVYDSSVALIGRSPNAVSARKAVEKLAKGSSHGNVYKFLKDERRQRKIDLLSNKRRT